MSFRAALSFDVVGIVGIILTVVLLVLDKAGKLKGGILIALLCLAGAMTLFLAVGNSWVLDAPPKWKLWRGALACALVFFTYSGLIIWISPTKGQEKPDEAKQEATPKKSSPLTCTVGITRVSYDEHVVLEDNKGNMALVAVISNKPTEAGVQVWRNVRGFLKFENGTKKEVFSGNGAWIGKAESVFTFDSGSKAQLVLAVLEESKEYAFAVSNSRSKKLRVVRFRNLERVMAASEERNIHSHVLTPTNMLIALTLTDSRGVWCGTFRFKYQQDKDGNISATLL